MSEIFREVRENLTMQQLAIHFRYVPNHAGFIRSPFKEERTASCKLYEHSFYDFSTNQGGDLIMFTAAVLGLDNWKSAQYLAETFHLPISLASSRDNIRQRQRRQQEQQHKQERQREFREAWLREVKKLKAWERIYTEALERQVFPPFSDLRCFSIKRLQEVSYKLDILCAADEEMYRRMKPDEKRNIPSDRPQWLLDTLEILAEDEEFFATEQELNQIERQRKLELQK
mgnify:CR=1 FL=1